MTAKYADANENHLSFPLRRRTQHEMVFNNTKSANVPKPCMRRSNSLPVKLEKAPLTRKLFWFRPSGSRGSSLTFPSTAESFFRDPPSTTLNPANNAALERTQNVQLPTISDMYDEDASGHTLIEEDIDELLGLSFIESAAYDSKTDF